jgi:hypothetical protein
MSDPLPPARPVPGGPPPLVDGQTVPHPPRPTGPPVTRRQLVYGLLCAGFILALVLVGVIRG